MTDTVKRTRIKKWTFDLFMERSKSIHGDKFDYSLITPNHIKGARSHVPFKCNTCLHEWNPTIFDHINGKHGCPSCAGNMKWTLTSFLDTAALIHGDDYDYSFITEAHIKNQKSHVPIFCLICDHYWEPTIDNHITGKTRCPSCEGKDPWTLDKVLAKGHQLHGNKFDYSRVTANDVQGVNSDIPITCNDCNYSWHITIASHINSVNGCPSCNKKLKWTLERFIQRADELHGNKYDYSLIDRNKEINSYVSIPLLCKTCNYQWVTCIGTHIHQGSGCPNCNCSKGEVQCERVLNEKGILFETQYRIGQYTKGYDFKFSYNGENYILEFDGEQHFNRINFFQRTDEAFREQQNRDMLYTKRALDSDLNFNVIRIDYTQIDKVEFHIDQAFACQQRLYLSTHTLYQHIIDYVMKFY